MTIALCTEGPTSENPDLQKRCCFIWPSGSGVHGGRKRRRGDRVAAVHNGAAHSCLVLPGVFRPAACDGRACSETQLFSPEKAGSKKSLEFSFPAPCNLFSPGLSFQVLRTNHSDSSAPRFFRKRAATDLVRDSIRQVADWLRPIFSGSSALEEAASVSGIFPFWMMQTLRSD